MSNDFDFRDMASDTFAIVGDNGTLMADKNKGVQVLFYIDTEEDDAATLVAGALRTRDMECVLIRANGDMNSAASHPVTEQIKKRFPMEYAAWKQNQVEDLVSGTPLKAWPLMPKGIMMEMTAGHIRSVEELANVSDSNLARYSDGRLWRDKANAWLAASKGAGEAAKYAVENQHLRESIAELKEQVAALMTQIGPDDETKRGHARPRKEAA